ncbi:hypothetical protein EDB84DRAFT_1442381 [Lactarius hengduanensis]|nr:hypothetical protein EDB84DRAFT_1442381 [Lactarius hengduanensis]
MHTPYPMPPSSRSTCHGTGNLKPFLKLLPCPSRAGIAALLEPHRAFDARSPTGMVWRCEDNSNCNDSEDDHDVDNSEDDLYDGNGEDNTTADGHNDRGVTAEGAMTTAGHRQCTGGAVVTPLRPTAHGLWVRIREEAV